MEENVQELEIPNLGGVPINKQDFFRVDSLMFLKDLNLDLGTVNDPNYSHFKQFADEMKSANVEIIELDSISAAPITYENIDLTGDYVSSFGSGNLLDFIIKLANGIEKVCIDMTYNPYTTKFNKDGYVETKNIKTYGLGDVYRSNMIIEAQNKKRANA